jgi:hypothetical protein
MSDLASQPLEYTSETRLTLAERRANYEDWLKCGRRTAMPVHTTRVDDLPSNTDIRAKAEADSAGKLINDLPLVAIVRTDNGTGDSKVELTDDLRLNIAQALLPKIEGATADQAERIASLTSTILRPALTRADDAKADENLKNDVLNQGKGGVNRNDDKTADDAAPTLATIMDTLGKITGRLDALEGKGKDSEHTVTPPEEKERKEIADDDTVNRSDAFKARALLEGIDGEIHSWKNQDRFAEFQARADQVSQLFGKSVSPPIAGETLGAYKRRTVREWQKFSPAFKNSDLKVLQVADSVAFNVAIEDILVRADKEGRNPTAIPVGYLAERSEVKGGHTFTRFYGRPSTWMNQFAPTGRRVRRIIERGQGGANRTLYEQA